MEKQFKSFLRFSTSEGAVKDFAYLLAQIDLYAPVERDLGKPARYGLAG